MHRRNTGNGSARNLARMQLRRPWALMLSCAAVLAGGAALTAGCGKAVTSPHVGSETHFLDGCGSDGCGAGLECIAGLCTLACQSDSECTALDAGALCSSRAGQSSCQLPCTGDGECSTGNPEWSCSAGRCGAWSLSADPVGTLTPGTCPAQPEPSLIQPFEVSTSVWQVPGTRSILGAVADSTGLYWMESDGSLMALPRGSDTSVVLHSPGPPTSPLLSLVSDEGHVYWSEVASVPQSVGDPGSIEPDGLLFRLAKSGGEAEIVLRMSGGLRAAAANESAVMIVAGTGALYALEPEGLRHVDAIPTSLGLRIRNDLAFWTRDSGDPSVVDLFFAPLSTGPARRLGELPYGVEFLLGNGLVLAKRQRVLSEPVRLVESFLRIDTATGCAIELPGLEQSIRSTAIDDRYVYWQSLNLYAGAEPLDAPPALGLVRMNLESLRIEQMVSPALDGSPGHEIVAHDDEHLYLAVNGVGPLLAVRKPD